MRKLLESKLEALKSLKEESSNWEYYLGQYNLCLELLEIIYKEGFEFMDWAEELTNNKYKEEDEELPF
jgi:hypothetical protein